ncbi:hypothetical protein KCU85_g302, partial [Aureobasidium melanogenum]
LCNSLILLLAFLLALVMRFYISAPSNVDSSQSTKTLLPLNTDCGGVGDLQDVSKHWSLPRPCPMSK